MERGLSLKSYIEHSQRDTSSRFGHSYKEFRIAAGAREHDLPGFAVASRG